MSKEENNQKHVSTFGVSILYSHEIIEPFMTFYVVFFAQSVFSYYFCTVAQLAL